MAATYTFKVTLAPNQGVFDVYATNQIEGSKEQKVDFKGGTKGTLQLDDGDYYINWDFSQANPGTKLTIELLDKDDASVKTFNDTLDVTKTAHADSGVFTVPKPAKGG